MARHRGVEPSHAEMVSSQRTPRRLMAPKRRTRPGRRIFLWMLASFFAVQLAAGVLLDRVWPQLRFSFLYKQLERLDEQQVPPTVVCLGSSRFGCGVSAEHMTDWLRQLTGD